MTISKNLKKKKNIVLVKRQITELYKFSSKVGYIINVIYLVHTYDPNGSIKLYFEAQEAVAAVVRTRMTSYVIVSRFSIDCKYIKYL